MFKLIALLFFSTINISPAGTKNSELARILHRPIRALSFPDFSSMGLFFALAVPLPDPQTAISLSYFFEASYALPTNSTLFEDWENKKKRRKRAIDRTTVFRLFENKFKSFGFSGRACLLRSICETSEFNLEENGVLGDIFNTIFKPSTSQPEDLPQDIIDAELIGQTASCTKYYRNCPVGLFDLIGILV